MSSRSVILVACVLGGCKGSVGAADVWDDTGIPGTSNPGGDVYDDCEAEQVDQTSFAYIEDDDGDDYDHHELLGHSFYCQDPQTIPAVEEVFVAHDGLIAHLKDGYNGSWLIESEVDEALDNAAV